MTQGWTGSFVDKTQPYQEAAELMRFQAALKIDPTLRNAGARKHRESIPFFENRFHILKL
ncbi:MAG: hypothetical protein WA191_08990 [Telluria sp.]|nr:hypothetical protein [Telluria sp.]